MLCRAFFTAAALILAGVIVILIIGFLTDFWLLDLNPFRAIWLVIAILKCETLGFVFLHLYVNE